MFWPLQIKRVEALSEPPADWNEKIAARIGSARASQAFAAGFAQGGCGNLDDPGLRVESLNERTKVALSKVPEVTFRLVPSNAAV